MRELARESFRLIHRFNVSHVTGVPIEVDEHGLFRHRFDLVRGVDEELAGMNLRMSLGRMHDDLKTAVDRLAPQIRREVHGAGS